MTKKPSKRLRYLVQFRTHRGSWSSYDNLLFEDEAQALFEFLRIRRDRDGDRAYVDLRITHGGRVLREERDGEAVDLPATLEQRLAALEDKVFGSS